MSDLKEMIRQANETAVNKLKNAQPYWVDIKPAHEVLGIDKYTLLHAGPPIAWEEMCGPMRGAIVAVLKYEGLAENDEEALALAGSGKIKYEPCHHHNAVGPMTGVTSYSMPMICVLNKENGNYAYSTINEGTGKGIRFGSCGQDTVDQLVWLEKVLGPALKDVVHTMGGINLKMIISQALAMGDELHMRNNAATNLFVKTIAETLCEVVESRAALTQIMHFLTWNNDQFFLNFAMAANKACADAAHGIEHSTMVTAMARNGVNIGIRVSGHYGNRRHWRHGHRYCPCHCSLPGCWQVPGRCELHQQHVRNHPFGAGSVCHAGYGFPWFAHRYRYSKSSGNRYFPHHQYRYCL